MMELRSDHELMEAIAAGDEVAFQGLVERHRREVYGTILKMLGDPHESEDLAQRVFLRVWQAAPRYRPEALFTTWLFTILRRLVFNECERRARVLSRIAPMPLFEEGEGGERESPDLLQKDPALQLVERERFGKVDAAIRSLPEKQRLALLLNVYHDMPYEEIAGVLKTSVSATKSILFRAREGMKGLLREEFGEF